MESFHQTQSIARRLTLTILAISTLFLLEFAGLYLSSREFINGFVTLYQAHQLVDTARQLKQVVSGFGEIVTKIANKEIGENPGAPLRTISGQSARLVKEGLNSSFENPEVRQMFRDIKEVMAQLEASGSRLSSTEADLAKEILIARQIELDAMEMLNKTQMKINTNSDQIFEEVYSARHRLLIVGIILAVFFVSFALLLGLRVTSRITLSINKLLDATQAISAGDLSVRAPIIASDEIGRLAHGFNRMTLKLSESTVSKNYVENIIESMLDSLIVLDSGGTIQRVNQVTTELFGYGQNELIGNPMGILFEKNFMLSSSIRNMETVCTSKEGVKIPVSVSTSPMHDQSKTASGIVCVIEDITSRKKAEDELRDRNLALAAANKELEAFSHSVSHDLRAPLRTIDGFSQALIEDYGPKFDEEGNRLLSRIRLGVQRMGKLIDDLLNLSRLSRTEMILKPVDLSAIAHGVAKELREGQPGRKVNFAISNGLVVRADPGLMKVMIENLISNAWKYTSKHPEANIEFGLTEREGRKVFYVKDDGAGFDMAYVKKLFGAFQRLHGADEFPGTGVGLATVQRIINRHGGSLWAEAQVERGATFYFTL